jgi:DNA-binding CsgD family transcriptional regulator
VETTAEGLTMALTGDGLRASVTAGLHAHVQFHSADPAGCLRTLVEVGGPRLLRMPSPWRPSLLALASTAALRCGDAVEARGWAAEAEATAEVAHLPVQRQHVRRAQAELHAARGDHHAAAALFHETAESFRRAGLPVEHAWTLVTGARSAYAAMGGDQAQDWFDAAAKAARGCGAHRVLEEVARTRKQLAVSRVTGASVTAVPVVRVGSAVALLTNREREIAALAATGKRTKDIAEQLYVSTRTVETHLGSIYRKLDIRSRAALLHTLSESTRPPTA